MPWPYQYDCRYFFTSQIIQQLYVCFSMHCTPIIYFCFRVSEVSKMNYKLFFLIFLQCMQYIPILLWKSMTSLSAYVRVFWRAWCLILNNRRKLTHGCICFFPFRIGFTWEFIMNLWLNNCKTKCNFKLVVINKIIISNIFINAV